MPLKLTNNAVSRLSASLGAASTTLGVMPMDGAKFPTLAAGDWCPLTIVKSDGTLEIVKATARTIDTFTIVRAQEGTAATDFSAGDRVELRMTSASVGELQQKTAEAKTAADNAQTSAENAQSTANSAKATADAALPASSATNALAMADTYTSVPTVFKAWMIAVTNPHLRIMIWDSVNSKYVRAPWHQPCKLFFSYDNPSSLPGALPVRADATWNQADFPDVVERLGLSGAGTFTLVEARGESIRVLDNGRGVDTGRALRSAQGDAMRNLTGKLGFLMYPSGTTPSSSEAVDGSYVGANSWAAGSSNVYNSTFNASRQVPTANEFRMRNIAFPLWMTI
jgi:hypothetical protein